MSLGKWVCLYLASVRQLASICCQFICSTGKSTVLMGWGRCMRLRHTLRLCAHLASLLFCHYYLFISFLMLIVYPVSLAVVNNYEILLLLLDLPVHFVKNKCICICQSYLFRLIKSWRESNLIVNYFIQGLHNWLFVFFISFLLYSVYIYIATKLQFGCWLITFLLLYLFN